MPKPHLPKTYRTRRRWNIAAARDALAALRSSGLSPGAFAVREGIDEQRLYRWQRRFASELLAGKAMPEFVEIRPRTPESVEIVLRSGRVLRVSEAIDLSALERLVAALERTEPC